MSPRGRPPLTARARELEPAPGRSEERGNVTAKKQVAWWKPPQPSPWSQAAVSRPWNGRWPTMDQVQPSHKHSWRETKCTRFYVYLLLRSPFGTWCVDTFTVPQVSAHCTTPLGPPCRFLWATDPCPAKGARAKGSRQLQAKRSRAQNVPFCLQLGPLWGIPSTCADTGRQSLVPNGPPPRLTVPHAVCGGDKWSVSLHSTVRPEAPCTTPSAQGYLRSTDAGTKWSLGTEAALMQA